MQANRGHLAATGLAFFILAAGVGCRQKVVSGAEASSTPPASQAGEVFSKGTRTVQIDDPQYGISAASMNIPSDWKFVGTVARDPGCHANGASMKYTAQSTNGATAIVLMPGVTWAWSTNPQMQQIMTSQMCPGVDLDSAAKFLVNIAVPNLRPGAKIEGVVPLSADIQAALDKQLVAEKQQLETMASHYGQPAPKVTIDGAAVKVLYTRNGLQVEEMVRSIVDCSESATPVFPGQQASTRRSCIARGVTIYRAPAGRLDQFVKDGDFSKIEKSMQVNQAWQSRVAQDQQAAFQRQQAQSNADFQRTMQQGRDANDRLLANGRAFDAAQQARTNQVMANDRARQQAIDNAAHGVTNYAADQQDFVNPGTGQTIQASSQYNHQWMSSDGGTLIQTNDHTFDPNGQVGAVSQSWSELVPK